MKEFDYKCSKCEKEMTLEAGKKARWCCGRRMRRLYPIPTIQFKGSGFYINDKEGE
jgi:predicted nucleic acid-binding Zn ribbon protein